jgi:hypothetical protein
VEKVLATAVAKIKKPDAKVLRTLLVARFSNWYGELDLVGRVLGLKFKTPGDGHAVVKAFMKKAEIEKAQTPAKPAAKKAKAAKA